MLEVSRRGLPSQSGREMSGQDTDCGHLKEGNPGAAPAVESGRLSPVRLHPALVLLQEPLEPWSHSCFRFEVQKVNLKSDFGVVSCCQ